jgi:hypothetical protein
MEFVITMIVLVVAAVVFLSNVFRQMNSEREQALRRSNLSTRRRDSNTERFLEEVNRRRQQASGQGKPPPPVRPAPLTPAPSTGPRREPYVRKVIPKTEKPRLVRPTDRPAPGPSQLLDVLPVELPAKSVRVVTAPPSEEPEALARQTPAQIGARPIAPLLRQILPFLRSRQSLRAGFVLHEILGPPRCRHQGNAIARLAQGHNQHNQSHASTQA